MIGGRENRFHELRQDPKALNDYSTASGELEEILDDHIEALAPKPMEGLKHCRRRSAKPSVVHIHGNKLVQKWQVFRLASAGVPGHHVIGSVQMQAILICYSASNGRLSRAASAADPIHMAQLFAYCCGIDYSSAFCKSHR